MSERAWCLSPDSLHISLQFYSYTAKLDHYFMFSYTFRIFHYVYPGRTFHHLQDRYRGLVLHPDAAPPLPLSHSCRQFLGIRSSWLSATCLGIVNVVFCPQNSCPEGSLGDLLAETDSVPIWLSEKTLGFRPGSTEASLLAAGIKTRIKYTPASS